MLKVWTDEQCSGTSNGITGRTDWEKGRRWWKTRGEWGGGRVAAIWHWNDSWQQQKKGTFFKLWHRNWLTEVAVKSTLTESERQQSADWICPSPPARTEIKTLLKEEDFQEVTWPLFQVLQLTEGNSTVQHAGKWSWGTVRGKEKLLLPLTLLLSVLFSVFLGAVGLAGGFLSQPQSRISSTLELESTLLSWFKPPASLRPPRCSKPALGSQFWRLPLSIIYHISVHWGEDGAQCWTTKSSRNWATNRSTDFHSLKKRWQCAVDCFVEKRVEFVSCEVLKSIQKRKKRKKNS